MTTKYKVYSQNFVRTTMTLIEKDVPKNMRYISVYYSTTDVKISATTTIITASTFISSIGGNLGLFLGFSFVTSMLFIYKQLEKWFHDKIFP